MQQAERIASEYYHGLCDPIEISERLPVPDSVYALADFTLKRELPFYPQLRDINRWNASYGTDPIRTMPLLYQVFRAEYLYHVQRGVELPVLMDAGGGRGIIAYLGALAGFRSFSVEQNEAMHLQGLSFKEELDSLFTESQPDVTLLHASYYTPEFYRFAAGKFIQYYGISTDRLNELDPSMEYIFGIPGCTQQQALDELFHLEQESVAFENSAIISGTTLMADTVFSYPSDPFFRWGFFRQMGTMLESGSRVVLSSVNSQVTRTMADDAPLRHAMHPTTAYTHDRHPYCIAFTKESTARDTE